MKNLTGFFPLRLATSLIIPLTILNRRVVRKKNGDTKGYYRNTAVNIDKWGNREFRTLWNDKLRTEDGYAFGRPDETISSALGKNQRDGTLTKTGRRLCWVLDKLDKNHCKNAIKEFENEEIK